MTPRALCLAVLIGVATLGLPGSAHASVSQVRVGNFFFEDATVGDGKVQIHQGDQLQFVVEDNGPGTPHSAEIDELGIHSGGLSVGDTYTTPAIQKAGTFKLYCKLHENRGHVTSLVVLASGATTTQAPATTAPATTAPATTAPATTATTTSRTGVTPTTVRGTTTSTTAPASSGSGTPTTIADGDPATAVEPDTTPDGTTDATLAPTGLGRASDDVLDSLPVEPGSLDAVLGRRAATRGPWTRSVRMALLALLPLLGIAALALVRFARIPEAATSRSSDEPGMPDATPTPVGRPRGHRRVRPLSARDAPVVET